MSRIKGRDTTIEIKLRKALWAKGLRFRVHSRLPGRPDIVFPGARIVVFVDGCFWHCCPLHTTIPKSNPSFWLAKLNGNVERDRRNETKLAELGWLVLRFWEHDVVENTPGIVEKIYFTVAASPKKHI